MIGVTVASFVMLAKLYEREAALTSRVILVSTVVSVFTVSLLVAWIGPL